MVAERLDRRGASLYQLGIGYSPANTKEYVYEEGLEHGQTSNRGR